MTENAGVLLLVHCANNRPITLPAGLDETLQHVKTRACAAHGLAPDTVLLWDFFCDSKYVLLEDQLHLSLAELYMQDGQPLLLEPRHGHLLQRQHSQLGGGKASRDSVLQLQVHCAVSGGSTQQMVIRRTAAYPWETVQVLKQRACAASGIDPESVLLWDYFNACPFILLEDQLHCTLQQAGLVHGQPLLLQPVGQAGQPPQQQPQHEARRQAWAGQVQREPQQQRQQQQDGTADADAAATTGLAPDCAAAAEELQQLKSCVVCLDAPRSVLLLPCKHLALCAGCAQQLQQRSGGSGDSDGAAGSSRDGGGGGAVAVPCPVCRVPATRNIPGVFFS